MWNWSKSRDLVMSGPAEVVIWSYPDLQKSWFGHVRTCKSRDLVMSGPAKTCPGGQVLTANQRKYFYFFRNYTFPSFINKFIILCKIICFYKKKMLIKKKGVQSEKIKVFPLVCSKYLSSWTGLGKSGHDQITTFG